MSNWAKLHSSPDLEMQVMRKYFRTSFPSNWNRYLFGTPCHEESVSSKLIPSLTVLNYL